MLEALVEGGSQEDLCVHLLAGEAIVHNLPRVALVAPAVELVREILNGDFGEGCSHFNAPRKQDALAKQRFDKLADRHSRRDGVRVDDDIWGDAFHSPRQVFLSGE